MIHNEINLSLSIFIHANISLMKNNHDYFKYTTYTTMKTFKLKGVGLRIKYNAMDAIFYIKTNNTKVHLKTLKEYSEE